MNEIIFRQIYSDAIVQILSGVIYLFVTILFSKWSVLLYRSKREGYTLLIFLAVSFFILGIVFVSFGIQRAYNPSYYISEYVH
jgi:hypothetical protein